MPDQLETRRKRALWRATHRGTKELDMIVGGYGKACIAAMSEDRLQTFENLLDVAEPKLQIWLLAPNVPDDVTSEFLALVVAIRAFHGLQNDDNGGDHALPVNPTR